MANSNTNTTAVAFGGTSTMSTPKGLSSTNRFIFDAITVHADAVSAALTVTLDNQGTPASGDYVDLQIAWSADGTSFDSDEHAMYLPRMDTFGTNDPGEDPCTRTFTLHVSGKQKFKLLAKANQGGTRTVNLSAIYNEHRMA
jgi:hypothetical protein